MTFSITPCIRQWNMVLESIAFIFILNCKVEIGNEGREGGGMSGDKGPQLDSSVPPGCP